MQNNENVKKKRLSQAFLNPTVERLKKWIEQINNTALESFSDSVINECNAKEQAANECLNMIAGFLEGRFKYADVQNAIAECKKFGFR